MGSSFGECIRERRERLRRLDRSLSVRGVAARIGVQPSYLSKVERGEVEPPSEAKIVLLAEVLGFAQLIRQLRDAPDEALDRVVREVRDGNW